MKRSNSINQFHRWSNIHMGGRHGIDRRQTINQLLRIEPSKSAAHRLHGAALLLLLALISVRAQYAIDWLSVDGGGGTSTGGGNWLSGTIGQSDAGGPMTGGNFSLVGGFWSFLSVVPTPGAPQLTVGLTATNTAVVSWPSPSTGWRLQQNTDPSTTGWVPPSENIFDDGVQRSIVGRPLTNRCFYRLIKP